MFDGLDSGRTVLAELLLLGRVRNWQYDFWKYKPKWVVTRYGVYTTVEILDWSVVLTTEELYDVE